MQKKNSSPLPAPTSLLMNNETNYSVPFFSFSQYRDKIVEIQIIDNERLEKEHAETEREFAHEHLPR